MDDRKQNNELTQLKRALSAIQELRTRLDEAEGRRAEPIAIIGMGCRFPGGAMSPAAYWDLLARGDDAISRVPLQRWTQEDAAKIDPEIAATEAVQWGGFLDHIDEFDPGFFGITPREANFMDPQQRLLLEVTWEALADAGQVMDELAGSRTGVFVGVHSHSSDYQWLELKAKAGIDVHTGTGTAHNVLAGRLSYWFDWHGPSVAMDTACSSSLVAVHMAVRSLRAGECELAVAGGVNVILSPEFSIVCARMNILSPDGRCKTFDASANGMVRGEGCGAVVLKRLADALADRDPILAVIRGTAMNQDGKTNGLTAPNGLSQQAVIRDALENAGVDAGQIGYVETHGTGTPLGDPIEIDSLSSVLEEAGASVRRRVVLGSAKANIGHLEGAAGIAGLIKAVLVLRNESIPPQIHFGRLNPHISLGDRFEIPTAMRAWVSGKEAARFAGVSSFGWSGTNAHVILEEAPAAAATAKSSGDTRAAGVQLLVLSAQTADALRATALSYREFLAEQGNAGDGFLEDVCYTAGARRTHLEYRMAVIGRSASEIAWNLANYLARSSGAAVRVGRREESAKATDNRVGVAPLPTDGAARDKALTTLAAEFVAGAKIDWANLFSPEARCVALPNYPWQRKKYWFDKGEGAGTAKIARGGTVALPGRRVRSPHAAFEVEVSLERFPHLAGHCVAGAAVMPGAMYIEIARAVASAMGFDAARVEDLELSEALVVEEGHDRTLQTVVRTESGGEAEFEIFSADAGVTGENAAWIRHASGRISTRSDATQTPDDDGPVDIERLRRKLAKEIRGAEFYRMIESNGVELGDAFASIDRLWLGDGEALGRVRVNEAEKDMTAEIAQMILLDGGLQVLLAALNETAGGGAAAAPYVMTGARSCEVFATLPAEMWSHATLHFPITRTGDAVEGDIEICDRGGHRVARFLGMRIQRSRAAKRPDWFYEVEWREANLPGDARDAQTSGFAISPREIADQAEKSQSGSRESAALAGTRGLLGDVEGIAAQFVAAALRTLGFDFSPGSGFEEGQEAARLGIVPRHRRLFGRLLEILAEEKILERAGSRWVVRRSPPTGSPASECAKFANEHAEIRTEISLLGRCGENLADVLRGQADPLKLLFPADSPITAANLYESSASARLYNALMGDAVAGAVATRVNGRPLRVMEIGAGTGGTTKYVIDRLSRENADFLFTDVSKAFLTEAAETFAGRKGLNFAIFDVEREPESQGISARSYDIVLAANVLHATRDLRATLRHARSLLVPGGLLLFLETTAPRRWVDLTFGLTEGWWKFADSELRPSHPLLAPEKWIGLLRECGFESPVAAGQPMSKGAILEQTIFIANAPLATGDGPAAAAGGARERHRATWLILSDRGAGVGDGAAELLRARGDDCVVLHAAPVEGAKDSPGLIDASRREDYERVLKNAAGNAGGPLRGILHLWALDAACKAPHALEQLEEARRLGCESVLALTQALDAMRADARPKLWIVTRNAQPAGSDTDALNVAQAPLWGMGRSVALEYPEAWGGLIDLDESASADASAARLVREITSDSGEDQIALRGERRYVARLVTAPSVKATSLEIRGDGAYLITGGLGGLGLTLAEWLAKQGARRVVLVGRRGFIDRSRWETLTPGSEEHSRAAAIQAIEAIGAKVEIAAADVGDREAMASIFARLAAEGAVLRGVIHAATLFEFRLLRDMDTAALLAMLRAKIEGSWNLHELTQSLPLDFFVMFSSGTALVGAKASAHYAAGNQFLDALAHYRRAQDLPGLSIDWGEWEQTRGITAEQRRHVESSGWRPMNAALALDAMRDLIAAGVTQQMVASFDPEIIKAAYQIRGRRPFLDEIGAARHAGAKKAGKGVDLIARLRSIPRGEQKEAIEAQVAAEVRRVMGIGAAEAIERDRGLFEMGLDSLMSVQLRSRLEASVGKPLPSTLIFNHPSIGALTDFLALELLGSDAAETEVPAASIGANPSNADWDEAAEEIAQLSDEEVRAQIAREVNAMQHEREE